MAEACIQCGGPIPDTKWVKTPEGWYCSQKCHMEPNAFRSI